VLIGQIEMVIKSSPLVPNREVVTVLMAEYAIDQQAANASDPAYSCNYDYSLGCSIPASSTSPTWKRLMISCDPTM
jgi:hypothetical protein